jgi:glycosyltransferase involved in cell wall biosynthesis
MKIAVVVHGRFESFDVTRELLALGHDVTLFTNYPRRVAQHFGIPRHRVQSYLAHGVVTRLLYRTSPGRAHGIVERLGNSAFGRWAAREVLREGWDAVIAFSGVAEDVFTGLGPTPTLRVLQRGSAHIRSQRQILEEEKRRSGRWVEKPSDWIIAREEREYQLADMIHVLSGFAERSFREQGVRPEKLYRLRLGVDTASFRASQAVVEARCRRLLSGEPIRVLNVGTFSLQKGALDFVEVIRELGTGRHSFRFVGPVAADARALKKAVAALATFIPKLPQQELPRAYEWGDVFVLPTIQDGFAMVLTQALASSLPLLTTTNCAGPDLIREGDQGWVVPVRDPKAIAERLRWCDQHRDELARMVRRVQQSSFAFDWAQTARQVEGNLRDALERKQERG